jgi:hypothetical protein
MLLLLCHPDTNDNAAEAPEHKAKPNFPQSQHTEGSESDLTLYSWEGQTAAFLSTCLSPIPTGFFSSLQPWSSFSFQQTRPLTSSFTILD